MLAVVGGALLWLPFHTFGMLDDWKDELRATGIPARATVYDRVTEKGGNRESASTTMYLRYVVNGRMHWEEVGCTQVCLPPDTEVPIWVNPADPTDFATDFDMLSGHRGRLQGGLGVVGLLLLTIGVPAILAKIGPRRKRRRPAVPVQGGGRFTGRTKHKRDGRRR
ncbi:hypothetical protein Ait01nite_085180 [Actinoplanes italicus]|nr:hypothetical protein Ait01nite_085180 [Actinoplanes italicus]